jgi:hypothetical protein
MMQDVGFRRNLALDPGGFGTVTMTKSITIDCGLDAGGISAAGMAAELNCGFALA